MASVNLFTVQDAVDHTIDFMGANVDEMAARDARRAVLNAYRELTMAHRWTLYYQRGRLTTVASQNDGTIEYDHTGGTYERMLTLSGATWPSWALYGVVVINSVVYQISDVKTSTVVILSNNSNPGADVASGTSYIAYRDTYTLPSDFREMDRLLNMTSQLYPEYVHVSNWLQPQRLTTVPALPRRYCVPIDHEILTKRGWKTYDQLSIGEPVMAYCNDTGEMEWQPLDGVHTFDCDETLLAIKRYGGKEFLFTKDHRWPAHCRKGTRKFVRGEDLNGYTLIPQKGEFQDRGSESALSPRMAAMLGWVITDGSGLWSKRHWNMRITQSPKKHLKEIAALFGKKPHGPDKRSGCYYVPVAKEDRAALRKMVPTRKDLVRVVGQLSREAAEAMWQAMFKAEGSTAKSNGQQMFAQAPHNIDVMDAFQMLCILTGRMAHILKQGANGQIACTVSKIKHLNPTKNGGITEQHYKGKVWCPQTKWGTWVMRRNGHVAITGNTIMGDPNYMGALALAFFPAPDAVYPFDYIYQRRPRSISVATYSTGKVTGGIGDTTLTGTSGTVWTSKLVGSIIRLGVDGVTLPTSSIGSKPFGTERVITAVGSTTSLTIDTPLTEAYTAVKYTVSDPVDIEEGAMQTAFLRCCEKQVAITRKQNSKVDYDQLYEKALEEARAADSRSFARRRAGYGAPYIQRLAYMPRAADIS